MCKAMQYFIGNTGLMEAYSSMLQYTGVYWRMQCVLTVIP